MKNLITFITICIISSMLFSSCVSNMTIAKRHYNNGYYVAYSKNKQPIILPKEEEREKKMQTSSNEYSFSPQNHTEHNTVTAYPSQSPMTENNDDVVASNKKNQPNVISRKRIKQELKQNAKSIEYTSTQPKHRLFQDKKVSSTPSDNEALSLFWVVILVILILWALGLLAGGFGLGGLINVLLVIALILLILWLLRIV